MCQPSPGRGVVINVQSDTLGGKIGGYGVNPWSKLARAKHDGRRVQRAQWWKACPCGRIETA